MPRLSPALGSHTVHPRHDDRRDQIQNQSAAAQQSEQRPAQPDPGGVPAEILGDTGAHTGDHPVLGITVQLLIHINLLLVGHLYDGVAQDLAVEFKTRLEHLGYNVLAQILVLNVHDGVHQLRVKFLALGLDLLDALLGKQLLELVEDHLQSLFVGIVLAALGGCGPFQIVIHRQEGLDGVALGILIDAILFLGGALAVVVILGSEAGELILHGFQLLGSQLHLLYLLPGKGDALFLLFFLLVNAI